MQFIKDLQDGIGSLLLQLAYNVIQKKVRSFLFQLACILGGGGVPKKKKNPRQVHSDHIIHK